MKNIKKALGFGRLVKSTVLFVPLSFSLIPHTEASQDEGDKTQYLTCETGIFSLGTASSEQVAQAATRLTKSLEDSGLLGGVLKLSMSRLYGQGNEGIKSSDLAEIFKNIHMTEVKERERIVSRALDFLLRLLPVKLNSHNIQLITQLPGELASGIFRGKREQVALPLKTSIELWTVFFRDGKGKDLVTRLQADLQRRLGLSADVEVESRLALFNSGNSSLVGYFKEKTHTPGAWPAVFTKAQSGADCKALSCFTNEDLQEFLIRYSDGDNLVAFFYHRSEYITSEQWDWIYENQNALDLPEEVKRRLNHKVAQVEAQKENAAAQSQIQELEASIAELENLVASYRKHLGAMKSFRSKYMEISSDRIKGINQFTSQPIIAGGRDAKVAKNFITLLKKRLPLDKSSLEKRIAISQCISAVVGMKERLAGSVVEQALETTQIAGLNAFDQRQIALQIRGLYRGFSRFEEAFESPIAGMLSSAPQIESFGLDDEFLDMDLDELDDRMDQVTRQLRESAGQLDRQRQELEALEQKRQQAGSRSVLRSLVGGSQGDAKDSD